MEDDGAHGIWVVNSEGDSTHISLVDMDPVQKALTIVDMFTPYLRHGLAAGANKQGDKWIPQISDNDGLWTSLYGVG